MKRRLQKLIICAAAALLIWGTLPGSAIDRAFFSLTAWSFADSPLIVTGEGTHEKPYALRTLHTDPADLHPDLLTNISITDDPDRVFQSSPPSPVDYAVILKNLRRLGRDSVAIGIPLSWAKTDVISLIALDQQLDAFPTAVTSAPLSRSPTPTPLPAAFRRASIPISQVKGSTTRLPIVNRVSIPDVVLGNKTSLAGFTVLESEAESDRPYLLARWDDRVVFSFHLLAALENFNVPPESVEIHSGRYVSLGTDGPYIPIDEYGRLLFAPPSPQDIDSIPAGTLIAAPDDFLADSKRGPVLIRDSMSSADETSLRFSESVVPTASLLIDPSGTSTAETFPRIPWYAELLFLASFLSLIHGLGNYPRSSGKLPLAGLAASVLILHFFIVPASATWIPTLPALAAAIVAIPLSTATRRRRTTTPRSTRRKDLGPLELNPHFPSKPY
jgi:hypothetical protein